VATGAMIAPTPHRPTPSAALWCRWAWLPGTGWARDVLLVADASGHWAHVEAGVRDAPAAARRIDAPVVPQLVNTHSHAFQRAFAGLSERRESEHDDFWSWRDRMYRVALTVTPEQLHAIARPLYRAMQQGGWGHVCEFHYLHRDQAGKPYGDRIAMARALIDAAQEAGLGITVLPVVYERAGFTQPNLREDQRRFACSLDEALHMRDAIRALRRPHVHAGLALHSLRAVTASTLARVASATSNDPGAIHMHVAEQAAEVDECVKATGLRPVEWLAANVALDTRWHLVHATHVTPTEIAAVAASGAGLVLCPTTEANLGDGITDLPRWLAHDVPMSVGTDSNVNTQVFEELRWLEYGQRLALHRRNVAAAPERGWPSTGERLFALCARGGAAAAGLAAWGLQVGAPAAWMTLAPNDATPPDDGIPGGAPRHALDVAIFAPR
jgi:formimidoylglutamate deiminase